MSPDESHLLAGCENGTFVLWRVATGERIWQTRHPMPGRLDAWDLSFADNGERFAVCSQGEEAVVFDARTGEPIRSITPIRAPRRWGCVESVALRPDGAEGFLVDRGQLYRFDVATGRLTHTRLSSNWPIRSVAGGTHVVSPSEMISVDDLTERPLGTFFNTGRIRPMPDGSLLVTAQSGPGADQAFTGTQIWPDGRADEVWRLGHRARVNERTDFLPGPMIGVSTDWEFTTTVTDLRTGQVVCEVDNSENCSGVSKRQRATLITCAVVATAALGGWLVWRVRPWRERTLRRSGSSDSG
ncbi:MAG TPA: WD40 repeat domain-containing protein [Urbifossiella sp.]|jgi:hypothetical protein|nr:WD40 repeat domain-containing protein [Urbifossiella sp.]